LACQDPLGATVPPVNDFIFVFETSRAGQETRPSLPGDRAAYAGILQSIHGC
jgi:hypothetical protein